jgi:hypothetical protein
MACHHHVNGVCDGHAAYTYAGTALDAVTTFKYLGIEICSRRGMLASHEMVRSAGLIIIIINPCKPYLSASATAPHPLGRRKAD